MGTRERIDDASRREPAAPVVGAVTSFEHPVHTGRADGHDVAVEHHVGDSAISLARILPDGGIRPGRLEGGGALLEELFPPLER